MLYFRLHYTIVLQCSNWWKLVVHRIWKTDRMTDLPNASPYFLNIFPIVLFGMRESTVGLNCVISTVQPVASAAALKQLSTFFLRAFSSSMLSALMVNSISERSGITLDAKPPLVTIPGSTLETTKYTFCSCYALLARCWTELFCGTRFTFGHTHYASVPVQIDGEKIIPLEPVKSCQNQFEQLKLRYIWNVFRVISIRSCRVQLLHLWWATAENPTETEKQHHLLTRDVDDFMLVGSWTRRWRLGTVDVGFMEE